MKLARAAMKLAPGVMKLARAAMKLAPGVMKLARGVMKLGFQCARTRWNLGFMCVSAGTLSWAVMLLSPVWPESGFCRGLVEAGVSRGGG